MANGPQSAADNAPDTNGLDQARLDVLEAQVRKIFSENDFHAADMRTIAREAGMGFNTIYKYFDGKEGLLFFFIRRWQQELDVRLKRELTQDMPGPQAFKKLAGAFLGYYEQNPDIGKILFLTLPMTTWMNNETFSQRALTGTLLDIIHRAQDDGAVRADLPAVAILDLFLGAVHRAFTMWIYRGAQPGLVDEAHGLFDLFWSGIAANGQARRQ
jgi:AcrR family transcriptional regulator